LADRRKRLTNLWTKVVDGEQGEWFSRIVIEATKPFDGTARRVPGGILFEGRDVFLNMPEGTIPVNDGLVREIRVGRTERPGGGEDVRVEIFPVLSGEVPFRMARVDSFPFRTELLLDRFPLVNLLKGKKIVVDPGHGGADPGGKGPVSLLEKNTVIPIARNLEKVLARAGAQVLLTRTGDETLSLEDRFDLAGRFGADFFVSIHMHTAADEKEEGAAVRCASGNNPAAELARHIGDELVGKLHVRNRGVLPGENLAPLAGMPAVEVEVVTITNIVEEVFLRSLTIQKRAAEAVFNGIVRYLAARAGVLSPAAPEQAGLFNPEFGPDNSGPVQRRERV
jgi:N-acetylmuramoyl-L-alanine amidase